MNRKAHLSVVISDRHRGKTMANISNFKGLVIRKKQLVTKQPCNVFIDECEIKEKD